MEYTEKIDTKVNKDTKKAILNIAKLEDRSFSGTIRLLIKEALLIRHKKDHEKL